MKLILIYIPKLAWEVAGNSPAKFLTLLFRLWYFAATRKLGGQKSDFPVQGIYNHSPVTFYLRYVMDIAVLREVFVDKEYDWCPIEKPAVIIDLGAHFGDTTLYYAARFPEAKIIAVEPSPENFERLVKHTKNNKNIFPVQAAIGGVEGSVDFYTGMEPFGHSVFNRKETDKKITVNQITLDTLFETYKIKKADLIKFDIEGAEFETFSHMNINSVPAYIGELHFDLNTNMNIAKIIDMFPDHRVKFENTSNINRNIMKATMKIISS
jgi:FkbM family methyltransferase